MYRWVAVLRLVLVVNTVGLNVQRGRFDHPVAAAVLIGGLVVWSLLVSWVYHSFSRRTTAWVLADLAVAVAAIALTPVVKGPGFHATIPGFWVMAAMFAWAVHWRLYGGLAAALALSVTDVLSRQHLTSTVYGNLFLLCIGGPIVGLMVDSLLRSAARTAAAEREAAAAAERARLARAVHDGVLQVLALVQRKGRELGGEAAELGELAGEQETRLRALIRQQDAVSADAEVDLVGAFAVLGSRPGLSIATPHASLPVPARLAEEVVAVVRACLDNVSAHVGVDAPAWVLLETFPDRVEVSVRDEGPGIPAGRLEAAADEGRLGVSESIRGRVSDLGGTATVHSGPGGTEWEIVVPLGAPS